jgi:hypothetical protein
MLLQIMPAFNFTNSFFSKGGHDWLYTINCTFLNLSPDTLKPTLLLFPLKPVMDLKNRTFGNDPIAITIPQSVNGFMQLIQPGCVILLYLVKESQLFGFSGVKTADTDS